MKHAQIVVGPAGVGKTTYCSTIQNHFETIKRTVHIVNQDPAAEDLVYTPSIDIREQISLENIMESQNVGPNGGLIQCFEYICENLDWLDTQLGEYDTDYLLFDCPGQIELYTHLPYMRKITQHLQNNGYRLCVQYLMDSSLLTDTNRFQSGCMICLSVMAQQELAHLSVLTKCDLLPDKDNIETFLELNIYELLHTVEEKYTHNPNLIQLQRVMAEILDQYSLVSFTPLDTTDDESIAAIVAKVDMITQYDEDLEPQEIPVE